MPLHSVAVAGVIHRDDRTLLIRRTDNNHWEPPGGVLELDEDIHAGLRREVLEETGLTINPIRLTGVYKNMKQHVICLVFLCEMTGGELTLDDEVAGFLWASAKDIQRLVRRVQAIRIFDALDRSNVQIRAHDGVDLL